MILQKYMERAYPCWDLFHKPQNDMLSPEISQADIASANYERFHHPSPVVQKRMHVIFLKAHGLPHQVIALASGLHPNSVTNTLRRYHHEGIEGLKRLSYQPPESTLMQRKASIEDDFRAHPPQSVAQAQSRIEEITGLKRSPSQVRRFMKRIGMRYQKTGQVPARADPQAQQVFLSEQLAPLLARASARQCHVFFVDAAHFVLGPFLCMLWCFTRVLLPAPAGRSRYNVLGAWHATEQHLEVITNTGSVHAETVLSLLGLLKHKYVDLPIYLVLDNARYQHCHMVEAQARSLGITLVFLPPYSPNLNLIERLWKFVKKKVLYGRYYEHFDRFKGAIDQCLDDINHQEQYREELRSLLTLKFQTFPVSQNQAA